MLLGFIGICLYFIQSVVAYWISVLDAFNYSSSSLPLERYVLVNTGE